MQVNLISSYRQPTRGGLPSLGLGVGLTTSHPKNKPVTKIHIEPQTWTDSVGKEAKLPNMGIRFGT
jgi:hypothetical protein